MKDGFILQNYLVSTSAFMTWKRLHHKPSYKVVPFNGNKNKLNRFDGRRTDPTAYKLSWSTPRHFKANTTSLSLMSNKESTAMPFSTHDLQSNPCSKSSAPTTMNIIEHTITQVPQDPKQQLQQDPKPTHDKPSSKHLLNQASALNQVLKES